MTSPRRTTRGQGLLVPRPSADDALQASHAAAFDLTACEWICVIRDGSPTEVSLRDALIHAHEIEDLDWADPLVATALVGLLVAIVTDADAVDAGVEFAERWRTGSFDEHVVEAYLNSWRHRFDLFDPEHPFYQVAGLTPLSGGPKPVALLVPQMATGNNVPLFASSTENNVAPLTPADAARRLVACHAWDTAAIKTGVRDDPLAKAGKTTGNPTGPLGQLGVVTVLGANLFETLLLNCPNDPRLQRGRPAWQRDDIGSSWDTRPPAGILDLLTWQSRRVRLVPHTINGQTVVTGAIVAAGDRVRALSPELEIRTAWRRVTTPTAGEVERPQRHRQGVSGWRGLGPLVIGATSGTEGYVSPGVIRQLKDYVDVGLIDDTHLMRVAITGVVYGNQSAVIEDTLFDVTPLPLRALDTAQGVAVRHCLEGMADQAAAVSKALNVLADNLRRSSGGDQVPWDRSQRPGDRFLLGLDAQAMRVLQGLSTEPEKADDAAIAWERLLRSDARQIAEELVDQAPSRTFLGHTDRDGRSIRASDATAFFAHALDKALLATRLSAHTQEGEPTHA